MGASSEAIVVTLANAPALIEGMVREASPERLKVRPVPGKWSIHEHAVHLSQVHGVFFTRLDKMLSEQNPVIERYDPPADQQAGSLLDVDLDTALARYRSDRAQLVKRLSALGAGDWARAAQHPQYRRYTIEIMFRHLALHDAFHGYRIEELLLENE